MSRPGLDVVIGSPEHNATVAWYYREAELLDDHDPGTWLREMVADEISYRIPLRETRRRGDGPAVRPRDFHIDERHAALRTRIERWATPSAWTEDPPACTRRFVSNVQVRTGEPGRLEVRSALLLYRTRDSRPAPDIISAERRDVLDVSAVRWRLRCREVRLDCAVVRLAGLDLLL